MRLRLLFTFALVFPSSSQELADAARGHTLLETQGCLGCHDFNRHLSKGPLAKLFKTHLTPARLVGAMWNHAPTMWKAIQQSAQPAPSMSATGAHDMLAWFAAAEYFEPAGNAKRGSRTFQARQCNRCHLEAAASEGPPLSKWPSLQNPVELFFAIWSHAPSMKAAMDRRAMNWPSLSTADLADIREYSETLNDTRAGAPRLQLGDSAKGRAIYQLRGCLNCHEGRRTREVFPLPHSFTELGAILWNHAPMMMSLPPALNRHEMADLTAYLWTSRYFEEGGNLVRGKAVFEDKRCSTCHKAFFSFAPHSAASMIAALWKHTPAVQERGAGKGIAWPTFLGTEMADLIAYLDFVRLSPLLE